MCNFTCPNNKVKFSKNKINKNLLFKQIKTHHLDYILNTKNHKVWENDEAQIPKQVFIYYFNHVQKCTRAKLTLGAKSS